MHCNYIHLTTINRWSVLRSTSAYREPGQPAAVETSDEASSFWLFLSDEIVFNIFRFLGPRDICAITETCSRWNLIANDKYLWKGMLRFFFNWAACSETRN